jgi:hypothetical protein
VRRRQFDGLAQVAQRIVQRLVRQAVHQVHVEVVEAGRAGHAGGAHRFVAVVDAPEGLKLGWLEALDADRQAVDAGLPIGLELSCSNVPGLASRVISMSRKRDALLDAPSRRPSAPALNRLGVPPPKKIELIAPVTACRS